VAYINASSEKVDAISSLNNIDSHLHSGCSAEQLIGIKLKN